MIHAVMLDEIIPKINAEVVKFQPPNLLSSIP